MHKQPVANNGAIVNTTKYFGNFVHVDNELKYILTSDGRLIPDENNGFEYQYNIKDHLGNTRIVFSQTGEVLQDESYYPFGMSLGSALSYSQPAAKENKYLYNGKELQTDFGLEWYDYGARFYDAQLARFHVVDPMAEIAYSWSPYHYGYSNPINFIDPDGLTAQYVNGLKAMNGYEDPNKYLDDYTLNKNTGEVKLVKETDDTHDRVLETNSNGEAKVAIDEVEKGILKDGQNFKNEDQVISVGGEDQPSAEGVKSFTLNLSEYVGKEIKGFSYSSNGSGDVSHMALGKYKRNRYTKSYGSPAALAKKIGSSFSLNNIVQQFHTHPEGKLGATQSAPQQSQDVRNLQNDKPFIPNASFIILYRIRGQKQPAEYDYTHEYIP